MKGRNRLGYALSLDDRIRDRAVQDQAADLDESNGCRGAATARWPPSGRTLCDSKGVEPVEHRLGFLDGRMGLLESRFRLFPSFVRVAVRGLGGGERFIGLA